MSSRADRGRRFGSRLETSSVTVPLHTPLALVEAAAVAQQPQAESRIARRIGLPRLRRTGLDQPAAARGAGLRPRNPQQQRHDPGLFRHEREPPAGREVEQARLAPGFDQHRPERRAARRLRSRAQNRGRIAGPHEQHTVRVEAELGQTGRMGPARFGVERILPDPEDRPLPRRPPGQPERDDRGGREARHALRVKLMQGSTDETAVQDSVELGQPEADPACHGGTAEGRGFFKMAAQGSQNGTVGHGLADGSCS